MAELNARLIAKASGTAGEVPQPADLEIAEIAVNTADGKFFTKHTDGTVKEVSGAGGGGAVDSVNGETGDVSLGIQDMDDYALRPDPSYPVFKYSVVMDDQNGCSSWRYRIVHRVNSDGKVRIGQDAQDLDGNAADRGSEISTWTGFQYSTVGPLGPWQTTGDVGSPVLGDICSRSYAFDADLSEELPIGSYDVWVRDQAATDGIPLGEGDVLRWNEEDERFVPQPIKDVRVTQDLDDVGYTGPGTPVVLPNGYTGDTNPSVDAVRFWGFENYDQPDDQAYFVVNPAQTGFEQIAVGDEITVDSDNWIPLTPQVIESIEEVETYPGSGVLASIRYNVPALWDIPRNTMLDADEITITPSSIKEQDGDVLTWVESIGKYVPAPPTGGGGGGAVDSVNGQTGVVSLGVGDLDDATSYSGGYGVWNDYKSEANPGGWDLESNQYFYLNKVDSNGKDWSDEWDNAPSSGTMFVRNTDDEEWIEVAYSATFDLSNRLQINTTALASSGVNIDYNPLQFAFAALFSTTPEDGQVLTWVAANNQWEPAAPAGGSGGGGAVDSVNGQTGVVSLGIQDMDDFELNPGAQTSGQGYDVKVSNNPAGDGEWTYAFSTRGLIQLGVNGEDGASSDELNGVSGGSTVYISKDDGPWTGYLLHSDGVVSGGRWIYLDASYPSTEFDGVSTIRLSATEPGNPPPAPLADGDILQWDNADQKFKPAQVGDALGAVTSVNGETGNVNLGIQDMDDFLLNTADPNVIVYSFEDCVLTADPISPGQWADPGNGDIRLNSTDSNGRDAYTAAVDRTPGDIWWRVNNGAWTGTTFAGFVNYGGRFGINISGLTVSDYASAGNIFEMAFSAPDYVPLAEGDILKWVDADQKFKPDQAIERIQDQDDFGLRLTTDVVAEFSERVASSAQASSNGQCYLDTNPFSYFGTYRGTNDEIKTALEQLEVGDDITFSSPGLSDHVTTVSFAYGTESATAGYLRISDAWPQEWVDIGVGNVSITVSSTAVAGSEIPLRDNDIIKWNASDLEFQPTQPIERIRDQEDFDYNYAQANIVTLNRTSSSTDYCDADGEFSYIQNDNTAVGDYFTYFGGLSDGSGGGSDKAEFDKLLAGDPLTFTFDNGVTHTTTFVTKGHNTQQEWYMTVADDFPAEALSTQTLVIASPKFSVSTDLTQQIPLAEGDVIAWDDSDQKFKPAQRPQRIQDQDDFELATTAIVSYNYDIHSINLSNSGMWYTSGTQIYIYDTDANLNTVTDDSNYGQDIIWYSQDQVNWTPTTGNYTDFLSYGRWDINPDSAPDTSEELYVTFTDPGDPRVPLADGDILQWVEADQKFRPAQLPSGGGGGGAVNSVNGETGDVSLGIQDMDDFQLKQNTPGITFDTWLNISTEEFTADGQVDGNTNGYIYFWAGGQDYVEMSQLQAGDSLIIVSGDGTETTVEVTQAAQTTGNNETGYIRTDGTWDPAASNPRMPVEFSSTRWGSTVDIQLADGDILQWNDTVNKFQPGPNKSGTTIEPPLTSESGYLTWYFIPDQGVAPGITTCSWYDAGAYTDSLFFSTTSIEGDYESLLYGIDANDDQITVFVNGFEVFKAQALRSLTRIAIE